MKHSRGMLIVLGLFATSTVGPMEAAPAAAAATPEEKELARQVLRSLDSDDSLSGDEARQLLRLSRSSPAARMEVFRLGFADEDAASSLSKNAPFVVKAAMGLDPSGKVSNAILADLLRPVLERPDAPHVLVGAAREILKCLPIEPGRAAETMLPRIMAENDDWDLKFGTLSELLPKCDPDHANRLAQKFRGHLPDSPPERAQWIGELLSILADRMDAADVDLLVKALQEQWSAAKNEEGRKGPAMALSSLAPKLPRDDARQLVSRLLTRHPKLLEGLEFDLVVRLVPLLDSESLKSIAADFSFRLEPPRASGVLFNRFMENMEGIISELSPSELRVLVAPKIKQVIKHPDKSRKVIPVLGPFAAALTPEEIRTLVTSLLEQLKVLQDDSAIDYAKMSLVALSYAMTPQQAWEPVNALVELSESRNEVMGPLFALAARLGKDGSRRLAAKLHTKIEAGGEALQVHLTILGGLASVLEPHELRTVLTNKIEALLRIAEGDEKLKGNYLRDARQSIEAVATNVPAEVARPLVVTLSAAMRKEQDGEDLAEIGRAVEVLSPALEARDLDVAISTISERIRIERQHHPLERLCTALGLLAAKANGEQAQTIAAAILERMKSERDGVELALLARVLVPSIEKVERTSLQSVLQMLNAAISEAGDGQSLAELGRCAGAIATPFPRQERERIAELLASRIALVPYPDMAEYSWVEDHSWPEPGKEVRNVEEAANILKEAKAQSLVDLLRAPLLGHDYMEEVVLVALGKRFDQQFANVAAFVNWATKDPAGRTLGLELEGPGPWSELPESKLTQVDLPPLQGVEIKPVGSIEIGGPVWTLCVEKGRAYLPAGVAGLKIVDVSNPANPKLLGTAKAGPFAMSCAAAGDYAYVAAGPAGWPESHLRVVDVSDPAKPEVVGTVKLPDYPAGVAMRGQHVLVADRTEGLRIIDVSKPSAPREVGALEVPSVIVGVAGSGDYAYLADEEVGLRVVDLTEPANPREVALVKTTGPAIDVWVEGQRAFVSMGDEGLAVVDISQPAKPAILITVPAELAIEVAAQGHLAAISGGPLGARVIDLKDLEKPRALDLEVSEMCVGVFLADDYLYITDVRPGGAPYGIDDKSILRIYKVID